MERLFIFRANHNALNLIIHAGAQEAGRLAIYEKFTVCTDEAVSHHGRAKTVVIRTNTDAYARLIDDMAQAADDFREILEDDDPVVQQYAKLTSFI